MKNSLCNMKRVSSGSISRWKFTNDIRFVKWAECVDSKS